MANHKRWTPALLQALCTDWETGAPTAELAEKYEISTTTLRTMVSQLRKQGYQFKHRSTGPRQPNNDNGRLAYEMRQEGISWPRIGEILKCSKQAAQQGAKRWEEHLTRRKS